mmetsp:Transcript_39446/g.85862  ORF Transcript_39446/g.85862 Transcript_39446/m.85862 type:complete len:259 (+) Transcript_39446:203-979(+)
MRPILCSYAMLLPTIVSARCGGAICLRHLCVGSTPPHSTRCFTRVPRVSSRQVMPGGPARRARRKPPRKSPSGAPSAPPRTRSGARPSRARARTAAWSTCLCIACAPPPPPPPQAAGTPPAAARPPGRGTCSPCTPAPALGRRPPFWSRAEALQVATAALDLPAPARAVERWPTLECPPRLRGADREWRREPCGIAIRSSPRARRTPPAQMLVWTPARTGPLLMWRMRLMRSVCWAHRCAWSTPSWGAGVPLSCPLSR